MLTLVLWKHVLFLCASRTVFRVSLVMGVRRMLCSVRLVRRTREFQTQPPKRLTITRLCDKFDKHDTICDVHSGRSGTPLTAANPDSSATVLEKFTTSPRKSATQCARETGVSSTSV